MMTSTNRITSSERALILASASPRRAELMRTAGYVVRIVTPPIDEPQAFSDDVPPAARAEAISYFKARSVAGLVDDGIIIGGDTVACIGRHVFGKPQDREDARAILGSLVGTTHQVITGVSLIEVPSGRRLIRHETTAITMRRMSDAQIEAYLDTGAWEGKAGAYGIQDHGDAFVERVEGSFTNVVGLPMELLASMLHDWGIDPKKEAAQRKTFQA